MFSKTRIMALTVLLISGCTREVYLQKVPCVDCEPCVEEPCQELTPTCCPELAMQTEVQVYQVYDNVPQPVSYTPCPRQNCQVEKPVSNCHTVCRKVMINQ